MTADIDAQFRDPAFETMTRRRLRPVSRGFAIRRETAVSVLLTGMFFIVMWRATGMWFGLPANFDEGAAVDPAPMRVLLYSLIPLIGIYACLEPKRFLSVFAQTSPLICIVLALCLVSIVISESVDASVKGAAAVILLTVPVILYRARYGGERLFYSFATFCIISAFANFLYTAAFPQFAIMRGSYAGMVKGLFYHKNILGQFCAVAFIVLLPMHRSEFRLTYRFVIKCSAILLTLGLVMLSRSSTAVVMVVAGLGILFGMTTLQRITNMTVRSMTVLVLAVVLVALGAAVYLGAIAAIAELFGKDVTFSGRTAIWEQLMPLIYQRPLMGYGFALFRQPEIMARFVSVTFDARSTHNTYLELALNIGIPATVLWVAFLLARLGRKLTKVQTTTRLKIVQKRDVALIVLVMTGAFMEAGFMLAPLVLWVSLVAALPLDATNRSYGNEGRRRRTSQPIAAQHTRNRLQHPTATAPGTAFPPAYGRSDWA